MQLLYRASLMYTVQEVATLIYAVVMALTMLLTPYTKEIKSASVYLIVTKVLRFYVFQALLINKLGSAIRTCK